MEKNIVDPGRPQMTIRHMCIACWTPKATKTHSQYVVLNAFPLQRLHERSSMLRYTYNGRLVTVESRRNPDPVRVRINTGGTLLAGSKRSGREAATILPFPYDICSVVSLQLTNT